MKKLLVTSMVLGAGFFLTSAAHAAITGSAHDFSATGWTTNGEICIACHTPHNANTTEANAPLWNHELTVAIYALYSSNSLHATDLGQPSGVSKLCLSCHDGTVALENFGGVTDGVNFVGGADVIGGGSDLSGHHPVSFTYDSALSTADGELFDPAVITTALGGTIDADMLFGGSLQCASCHDVHNTNTAALSLLLIDNAGSALCLTCHDK